ncbi:MULTISPECIES: aminomethyltransferase family protein [Rhodococcus]|uniref:aminomethyltransferase family protein n=1 Tax=Rhodococcus TaxID=1827 RepID=UPI000EA9266E|nr:MULTISPECIES: aminomethyltransferase family protein [Rhodococcus]NHU48307.1 aminomethyl transferase family protein [Rhodococcus sp. A14]MDI9941087.1 aminomethyltransferase family protein [Rhodococcus sp. IEGM 1351]MDJ0418508.1 aminomethyltransferase family protein [Rhodococcus opacus]QZS56852.1 aminomethyltransferase family protein [Rhodococcus opacus]RKM76522.1 glycine cleavage system protein T [Rhodococcus opacus]
MTTNPLLGFLRNAPATYHPGWGGPEYSDWQDEQMSWKTTCYLGDWSFLWDLQVDGPDALKLFRDSSINSYENFPIGAAKHLVQCNENGKVVAEGVLMRLGEQSFATQSVTAMWTAWLIHTGDYDVTYTKPSRFQFQVSGPNALAVCQKVTGESLTDLKFMRFRTVTIAGVEVQALRQGMAGEIGFEFHGDAAHSEAVRSAILEAGEDYGIRRLGRRTAMINHLEAAFPTGGWHYLSDLFADGFLEWMNAEFDLFGLSGKLGGSYDSDNLDDYLLSPVALGWGKSIKFDHEFTGRAALEKEVEHPTKVRVTLEFDKNDVVDIYASLFDEGEPYQFLDIPHQQRWVAWADTIQNADGETIGLSSVPGYSYYFRKVITLSFIDPAYSTPGTEVFVLWGDPGCPRQKLIRATVASAPYKKDNRRTELDTLVPSS